MTNLSGIENLYKELKTEWSRKPQNLKKCGQLLNVLKVFCFSYNLTMPVTFRKFIYSVFVNNIGRANQIGFPAHWRYENKQKRNGSSSRCSRNCSGIQRGK